MTPTRRAAIGMLGAAAAAPVMGLTPLPPAKLELAALEKRSGGRLGVAILNTATGAILGHRIDERFGMCSTFKLPLAAAVLAEIDAGRLDGERVLRFHQSEIVANSPVTSTHAARDGMTVSDLAKAAQQLSDNTAANLLIKLLGGPEGVTKAFRRLGDRISRLDQYEPEMNFVPPGAMNNTTTPRGMALGMQSYLLGNALSTASRATLTDWMSDTRTGVRRLRAGFPADWKAGDKTGSSWNEAKMVDKVNDVAIVTPPGHAPLIVTAYLDGAGSSPSIRPEDEAILAEVGRIAAGAIA